MKTCYYSEELGLYHKAGIFFPENFNAHFRSESYKKRLRRNREELRGQLIAAGKPVPDDLIPRSIQTELKLLIKSTRGELFTVQERDLFRYSDNNERLALEHLKMGVSGLFENSPLSLILKRVLGMNPAMAITPAITTPRSSTLDFAQYFLDNYGWFFRRWSDHFHNPLLQLILTYRENLINYGHWDSVLWRLRGASFQNTPEELEAERRDAHFLWQNLVLSESEVLQRVPEANPIIAQAISEHELWFFRLFDGLFRVVLPSDTGAKAALEPLLVNNPLLQWAFTPVRINLAIEVEGFSGEEGLATSSLGSGALDNDLEQKHNSAGLGVGATPKNLNTSAEVLVGKKIIPHRFPATEDEVTSLRDLPNLKFSAEELLDRTCWLPCPTMDWEFLCHAFGICDADEDMEMSSPGSATRTGTEVPDAKQEEHTDLLGAGLPADQRQELAGRLAEAFHTYAVPDFNAEATIPVLGRGYGKRYEAFTLAAKRMAEAVAAEAGAVAGAVEAVGQESLSVGVVAESLSNSEGARGADSTASTTTSVGAAAEAAAAADPAINPLVHGKGTTNQVFQNARKKQQHSMKRNDELWEGEVRMTGLTPDWDKEIVQQTLQELVANNSSADASTRRKLHDALAPQYAEDQVYAKSHHAARLTAQQRLIPKTRPPTRLESELPFFGSASRGDLLPNFLTGFSEAHADVESLESKQRPFRVMYAISGIEDADGKPKSEVGCHHDGERIHLEWSWAYGTGSS